MKKNNFITLLSLLLVSTFLTSCGNKAIWSISEPVLILKPKADQPHISEVKNTKIHTSVKSTIPNSLSFSQFKYFLGFSKEKYNLDLNLESQLHFKKQDVGLNLKVTSLCALIKNQANQLTHITHVTKIKIKKILSFVSFLPKEALNITQTSLLPKTLKCNFTFTASNKNNDQHTFRLNQKMTNIKNTNLASSHLHLDFFQAEYREKLKEKKLIVINKKPRSQFLQFTEKNLDEVYIKSLNSSDTLRLRCQNTDLNSVVNLHTLKQQKKDLFLSEFNSTKNLIRHDISKNTSCRVIQYDQFNNILKLSTLFTIHLDNITYTPAQLKPYLPTDPCDPAHPRYNYQHCQHTY